jgi:hypothetical protein
MSANIQQSGLRDAIRRARVTGALQKPFDVDRVIRIIQEAAST